ncbi:hypothetical protein C357_07901 [Citreicella sp. 357]|nr:hypothetical protein C357_07901 [Citreicella sp. 357]
MRLVRTMKAIRRMAVPRFAIAKWDVEAVRSISDLQKRR